MLSREETDSLGTVLVPSEAYWGAQTARSIANFQIGDETQSERKAVFPDPHLGHIVMVVVAGRGPRSGVSYGRWGGGVGVVGDFRRGVAVVVVAGRGP